MDSGMVWQRLTVVAFVGLLAVTGCTRDKPAPTPTPTALAEVELVTPPPVASPTGAPVAPEVTYHTVREGDTAWTIADQYGITLEELVAANDLPDPDRLQPGQQLVIPLGGDVAPGSDREGEAAPSAEDQSGTGTVHVVVAGDTLWSIAADYGVTVDELASKNDLDPEAILSLGQELMIP